jgi:hypothetical protein
MPPLDVEKTSEKQENIFPLPSLERFLRQSIAPTIDS